MTICRQLLEDKARAAHSRERVLRFSTYTDCQDPCAEWIVRAENVLESLDSRMADYGWVRLALSESLAYRLLKAMHGAVDAFLERP